ncbi:ATP-binding protein [Algiphilus sp.]|uniref:AAA family ATPase n=1 Tax=Algiphilus sp. TaxID=1872431 RepID=UPI0025C499C7|nr:ATP-binding protein [Algiphilus sp.]MCK5770895.1 ATP-binding protein [Algiphilus sp.]
MARSDLLVSLVKSSASGDKQAFQKAVEAIIAEERAKQHNILADRLTRAIQLNGSGAHRTNPVLETTAKHREYLSEVRPRRQLEDLVLPDTVKQAISELVEEQQRADLLRSNGLEPRHRVLLVGPPGTGKTSMAEAIAEAVAVPLFVVRYEAMIGSYLGETAARMKRVFDYARTTPCVLFFDEFDAIGKERGDIHETGEIKRVVTSLLMQVDDLPSYTIVVGATNHPELLDRASWRRFQLRLSLPMPTRKALAEYIDRFAERFDDTLGYTSSTIAKKLGRISYAEAEQFCLDILRRHVLTLGEKPLKAVVADQLNIWTVRAEQQDYTSGRIDNGGPAATDPSEA